MGLNIIQDQGSISKVSVIGTGQVGMACAFALICQVIKICFWNKKIEANLFSMNLGYL